MARQRIIVGIGEALIGDSPDRSADHAPMGLALEIAMQAARMGHVGIPISRLGQDKAGAEVFLQLTAMGLDVSHLQSDPDLPTAQRLVRRIGATTSVSLDPVAAFDNLQWDFDLVDVAQAADAVVFGDLARRGGQTRTVIGQFLLECRKAIRVYDLTRRDHAALERSRALSGLKNTEGVVVDPPALQVLCPALASAAPRDAAGELIRQHNLSFLVLVDSRQPLSIFTADQSVVADRSYAAGAHTAGLLALVHGLLEARDLQSCANLSSAVAQYAADHPLQPIPAPMLDVRA